MIFAAWILVLMLLTVLFNNMLARQYNPNTRVQTQISAEGVREVVLERNRYHHYVATGRINGAPVEFLLDTGATHVAVPVSMAKRLGLRWGRPMSTMTANGLITTYLTTLDRIELGDITLDNIPANINPHAEGDGVLLGMSFLKHVELIQRGNTLTLRQYSPSP
jgi:aspartyl protease family protein